MKKVLVIGATGAMGSYLVPELLEKGYRVDGLTLDDKKSEDENLRYIKANASDIGVLGEILKTRYDAVVDFMQYYSKEQFAPFMKLFLDSTDHYIFLSTARVYADVNPAREDSLRIREAKMPKEFVYDREYAIFKADEEDMLRESGRKNFTITRPTITYSTNRYQLVTLEAPVVYRRMTEGKTVVLPEGAIDRQGTMTWAGDTAKMFGAIILNEKALGETYTLTTSEHHSWREIAELYGKIGGLKYCVTDDETYLNIFAPGSVPLRQQLIFSRNYDRTYDNARILALSGLHESDLMPLEKGLRLELAKADLSRIPAAAEVNARMDEYLRQNGIE